MDGLSGSIQPMKLDTLALPKPNQLVFVGTFWIPEEMVSAWLTKPDGNGEALSQGRAEQDGSYRIGVNIKLPAGTYVVAAYGQRSETYGSAVLIVKDDGSVQVQNSNGLTLKALGDKNTIKGFARPLNR